MKYHGYDTKHHLMTWFNFWRSVENKKNLH